MDIKSAIDTLVNRIDLEPAEMQQMMQQMMQGELTESQIAAIMIGLRMKGETIDEITAAATVMREKAHKIDLSDLPNLVDIVGTGGDGQNLFNVSTAASFVIAAAGAHVAKHGSRGVSSNSGASDLLSQAGVALDISIAEVERGIRELGIGFLFAPNHHPAMRFAAAARRDLGVRSLFNVLGPLTSPASVPHIVVGVFNQRLCRPIAEVLQKLETVHALVVHSSDGLDEISLAASTSIAELKDNAIHEWTLTPEDIGIESQSLVGLSVENSSQSLALIKDALAKKKSDIGHKAAQMIMLNAGAGIYVSGLSSNLKQGVEWAQDIVYSGQALEKMDVFAEFTRSIKQDEEITKSRS